MFIFLSRDGVRTIIIIALVELQPPIPLTWVATQASQENITSMRQKSLITIFFKIRVIQMKMSKVLTNFIFGFSSYSDFWTGSTIIYIDRSIKTPLHFCIFFAFHLCPPLHNKMVHPKWRMWSSYFDSIAK